MHQPRSKRFVAVFVALTLAFSALMNTACHSGGTPTTPSPGVSEPQPAPPSTVRLISVDAKAIEVQGADPATGEALRLRVEGMDSAHPTYYVNGVPSGELFGNATTASANRPQDRLRPYVAQVGFLIWFALAAYTAHQIFWACGPQLYFGTQNGTLSEQAWDNCVIAVVAEVAGKIVGAQYIKLGVEEVRKRIKATIGTLITWANLRAVLNKKTYTTAVEVVEALIGQYCEALIESLIALFEALRSEQPPDPPNPNPNPDPNMKTLTVSVVGLGKVTSSAGGITCPGVCSAQFPVSTAVTLGAYANSGGTFVSWSGDCSGASSLCSFRMNESKAMTATFSQTATQTWVGAFTAKGTFQLDDKCVWSFVEEFSNVRLTLLANGTGTLSALTRTTEGPKIDGPAQCPNNTYVREQNDLFQLSWTSEGGGQRFELVPQTPSIRSLRGIASPTGASGTYSLKTGAIGAGGVRQSSADFTLTPSR